MITQNFSLTGPKFSDFSDFLLKLYNSLTGKTSLSFPVGVGTLHDPEISEKLQNSVILHFPKGFRDFSQKFKPRLIQVSF